MKDLYDVLRQKEQEFKRLAKEIEALRLTAALLAESKPEAATNENGKTAATSTSSSKSFVAVEAGGNGSGWEEAPARWP